MSKIYNINNHLMEYNNNCINYKVNPNPLNLPANTIRIKFLSGYRPTMGDTQTRVTSYQDNVWDIYIQSNVWEDLFFRNSYVTEVLGANTTNVTNMVRLFGMCVQLTKVALFDTSNVTDMTMMFDTCYKLNSVPLFDMKNVTNCSWMFYNCNLLNNIPLFDTSNVTDMNQMFNHCYNITTVPLFDTSKVTTIDQMFSYCTSLTSVPSFDTSNVTSMNNTFSVCSSLNYITLFDTSKVTNMASMFYGCTNVQSGALAFYQQASTQTIPPTNHNGTFHNCGINTQTGSAELSQIPSDWK